jgi:hypothetical protein
MHKIFHVVAQSLLALLGQRQAAFVLQQAANALL